MVWGFHRVLRLFGFKRIVQASGIGVQGLEFRVVLRGVLLGCAKVLAIVLLTPAFLYAIFRVL